MMSKSNVKPSEFYYKRYKDTGRIEYLQMAREVDDFYDNANIKGKISIPKYKFSEVDKSNVPRRHSEPKEPTNKFFEKERNCGKFVGKASILAKDDQNIIFNISSIAYPETQLDVKLSSEQVKQAYNLLFK